MSSCWCIFIFAWSWNEINWISRNWKFNKSSKLFVAVREWTQDCVLCSATVNFHHSLNHARVLIDKTLTYRMLAELRDMFSWEIHIISLCNLKSLVKNFSAELSSLTLLFFFVFLFTNAKCWDRDEKFITTWLYARTINRKIYKSSASQSYSCGFHIRNK